jgi:hypothetical protein
VTANDEELPHGAMAEQPDSFHVLPAGRVAEKLASL